MWASRLHWRMRGAWMWPAFFGLTLLDGVALNARPIAGESTALVSGLLLGAFLNLLVVAVAAPLAGRLLRRRRPELPQVVAADYAGTALMVVVTLGLLLGGALHRPAVQDGQRDFAAQAAAVRRYVGHQAPAPYRSNLARADTRRVDADLVRTCVPGPDPERALCLFVDTSQEPPGIRVDPNRETNRSFGGRRGLGP
jgi:hypothetical protein